MVPASVTKCKNSLNFLFSSTIKNATTDNIIANIRK